MNKIWKRIAVVAVSGLLLISLLASIAIAATTTYQGRKAIATTGTRVALAGAQEVDWVVIVACIGNDQPITIGSVTVTVDQSSTDGPRIEAGKSLRLGPCDLADVYINGKAENSVYYVAASGTGTAGLEVVQPTAADLNATVVQSTATNLHVEAEQATASELNATIVPLGWSYSGEKGVATTAIKASAGMLHGVMIETDGINDVTVQLYDHASTATNPITPAIVVPGTDRYGSIMDIDAVCSNGIVLVLSGTGGVATVLYK